MIVSPSLYSGNMKFWDAAWRGRNNRTGKGRCSSPSPSPSPVEQKGYKLKINGGTLSARAFVPKWPFRKVDRSLYTTGAGGIVLEKKMGIKKRPDFLSDFLSNFGTVVRSSRKDIIDKPVASWSGGLAKVLGNKVGEKGSLWSRTFSRTESISRDDLLPRVRGRTVNQREKEESFAPRLNNTLISLRVEVLDPTFSLISIHGEFKNISLTLLPRTDNVSADKAYIAFLRRETKVGTIKNIDWKLFLQLNTRKRADRWSDKLCNYRIHEKFSVALLFTLFILIIYYLYLLFI